MRKALELSTTTAPAAAAIGLHSRETLSRRARQDDLDTRERAGRQLEDRIIFPAELDRLARAPG